ncbi:caspase family protein [Mesorhizobium sophorae]|uniref:caspase family protein n=1 Tax=Mesorhizobium sophorae TaxID=1300294 RepID=UPI000BA4B75A|nr:caspase family protein [Mesorhizobium sophorae]
MSNFALVIGINQYPHGADQQPLFGAVSDAADFAEWVLHPDGGNVPPDKLHVWTYPPAAAQPGSRLSEFLAAPTAWWNGADVVPDPTRGPTVDEITETAEEAAKRAFAERQNQQSESRLFIFFAGHGVQGKTQTDLEPQTCFLANDYQGQVNRIRGLVPANDLRIAMLAQGFSEVFMFLDCCRLNLVRSNAVVQSLNFNRAPSPDDVRWGAGFAADRNSVAWETPDPNPTRGAFSKILIEGLRRVRDANNTLTAYALEDYVANRIEAVVHPRKQRPLFTGDPGLRALILANGPPIQLGSEDVVINLGGLPAGTQVFLKDANGIVLSTFPAGPVDRRIALEVGRLYSLETADGSVEKGFLHGDDGDRRVDL